MTFSKIQMEEEYSSEATNRMQEGLRLEIEKLETKYASLKTRLEEAEYKIKIILGTG